MIGLDVRDDRGLRTELQERAVALVGLDDEPLAGAVRRVGADLVDLAADHEARLPARRCAGSARASTTSWSCRANRRPRSCAGSRRARRARPSGAAPGSPRSRAATSSTFRAGIAVEYTTASASARHVLGAVADVHVHAGGREPVERDRLLQVGAAHLVTHAREQQRDRAHARRRPTPTMCTRRGRERSSGGTRSRGARRVVRHARTPRRDRRPAPRRRAGRARARPRPSARAGPASASSSETTRVEPRPRRTRRRAPRPPRPARSSVCALRVWWSLGEPGSGTSTAGTPATVSSAIVPAPGPAHRERRAARAARPCAPRTATSSYTSASPARRCASSAACALVEVARAADVVHGEVGAVAPAVVAAERGPVDRARALRAAEHREQRGIALRARARSRRSPTRTGLPVSVAPGSGVSGSDTAGARAEPHADAVREPGRRVLFVHDVGTRRSARRDDARQRRVAAEPDDDARAVAAHEHAARRTNADDRARRSRRRCRA